MTADEFVPWAMARAEGEPRHELNNGEVVAMAPERAIHNRVKLEVVVRLRDAIRARGLACEAFTDGMAIRVDDARVFEPDAPMRRGPPLPPDAVVSDDPLLVVEVSSPSTTRVDLRTKFALCFRLPSLRHYPMVGASDRVVVHHERTEAGEGGAATELRSRILPPEGTLRLDPPGIELDLARLFGLG